MYHNGGSYHIGISNEFKKREILIGKLSKFTKNVRKYRHLIHEVDGLLKKYPEIDLKKEVFIYLC